MVEAEGHDIQRDDLAEREDDDVGITSMQIIE